MGRRVIVTAVLLVTTGCLSPFTRRLDQANDSAAELNRQLAVAIVKLDEAKAILERSEVKMDEANRTFLRLEHRIDEMDKKMGIMEQGFRKMFGIKGPQPEEE